MIYLIDDDRFRQQKEYTGGFLEKVPYSTIVRCIYQLNIDDKIISIQKDDVVLLHLSLPDFKNNLILEGSTTIYESLIDNAHAHNCPLVIFSNGFNQEPEFDTVKNEIKTINKREFYLRLKDFLDKYLSTEKIELRILAYGKNFIARELSSIFDQISRLFTPSIGLNQEELYLLNKQFAERVGSVELESKLLQLSQIENPREVYLPYMEKIILSFIKYGRNIYH